MKQLSQTQLKPEYSNWVSKWIPITGGIATVLLAAGSVTVFRLTKQTTWLGLVLIVLAVIACVVTLYMFIARGILSYHGGGVQGKVLDGVLSQLEALGWDGKGKLLDIGCGSGAMSIKAAKKFPDVVVTGMDYWGAGWDYSKTLCESNAKIEGVAERITFQKGDAAKLDFSDGTFDAAISNFVFHEVMSQPDKFALVREALRVVKPGGYFVFEDIFFAKSHYGDIHKFVKALEPYTAEVHFLDMRRPGYAPVLLNTPLILGQMGIICGRK